MNYNSLVEIVNTIMLQYLPDLLLNDVNDLLNRY